MRRRRSPVQRTTRGETYVPTARSGGAGRSAALARREALLRREQDLQQRREILEERRAAREAEGRRRSEEDRESELRLEREEEQLRREEGLEDLQDLAEGSGGDNDQEGGAPPATVSEDVYDAFRLETHTKLAAESIAACGDCIHDVLMGMEGMTR